MYYYSDGQNEVGPFSLAKLRILKESGLIGSGTLVRRSDTGPWTPFGQMSDAGTVALLGPVAVSLALALQHSPSAYVVTVAVAAVASFLTPIGHHGNLLVYGPGGYQFTDFIRVGVPLTLLVAVITVFLVQVLWPI